MNQHSYADEMDEGWINIYENPPGSNAVPCSCIWPTEEIAVKRQLEEHFVARVKIKWPKKKL